MEFTKYDDLLEYVGVQLPDCPKVLITQTIRRIARRFCEETQAWQYDLSPIRIRKDKSDYDLDLDEITCAEIFRVWNVRLVKNEDVNPKGTVLDPNRDWTLKGDNHRTFHFLNKPTETISKGLRIRVALRPTRNANEIEKFMFDEYYEAIAAGVMAMLMRIPRKPWTNTREARNMLTDFDNGVAVARIDVSRGFTNMEIMNNTGASFAV